MKRSLLWRAVLILAVIAGWTYALFPVRDQDYLTTFNKLVRLTVPKRLDEALAKTQQMVKAAHAKGETALTPMDALREVVGTDEVRVNLSEFIDVKDEPKKPAAEAEDKAAKPETKPAIRRKATNAEVLDYVAKLSKDKDLYAVCREQTLQDAKVRLDKVLAEATRRVEQSRQAARAVEARIAAGAKDLPLPRVQPIEAALLEVVQENGIELCHFVPIYGKIEPLNSEVIGYVRDAARGKLRLGLDLRGGTEFHITFDEAKVPQGETATQLRDGIIEILRKRVDPFGVAEIEMRPTGSNSIGLITPSVDPGEVQRIRDTITKGGKLTFRMVHEDNESLLREERGSVPGYVQVPNVRNDSRGNKSTSRIWVRNYDEKVNGSQLLSAKPQQRATGDHEVAMHYNAEGGKYMFETTSAAVRREQETGKPQLMAILLDGVVISAPHVQGAFGADGVITGSFTQDEVSQLSLLLRSGNLPVDIKIDSEMGTAPMLGEAMIRSSEIACIVGTVLVVAFMLIYYRIAGVVANIAMILNVLLLLGTMPILRATLTLPGIAGIVLTIGMSVDANVLIYERMREEMNNGKSIATAIKNSYARVFWTIFDSHLTTLLTAYFLYIFGTGTVKGFAVTLSIGLIANMFTALVVTRWIFDLLLQSNLLTNRHLLHARVAKEGEPPPKIIHWPWVRLSYLFFAISMVMVLGILIVFGVRGKGALGVDFTGGLLVTMQYGGDQKVTPEQLSGALEKLGLKNARASYKFSMVGSEQLVDVVLPASPSLDAKIVKAREAKHSVAEVLTDDLNRAFPAAKLSHGSSAEVGALVGREFRLKGIYALLASFVAILIYLSFRFEFGYALGAVVALIHDALIATGFLLIAGWGERQFSLIALAAVLTVIGYSINDSVVIFDRMRENMDFHKEMKFLDIIDLSLNQVFSRTILTALTVFMVVLSLYVFGGGPINDFSYVMLVGTIVGCYSSVFVATPVMIWWHNWRGRSSLTAPAPPAPSRPDPDVEAAAATNG